MTYNDDTSDVEKAAREWVAKWRPAEESWVDYELSIKAYIAAWQSAQRHILTEARKNFDILLGREDGAAVSLTKLSEICGVKEGEEK